MSDVTPANPVKPLKGFAKKKFLGIPVLYLAALFVTILAVIAWRMKSSTATDPNADPTATNADLTGDQPTNDNGDLLPTLSGGTVVAGNVDSVPDPTKVATNDTWYKSAVEWLANSQSVNSGDAQAALQAYLSGANLTYAQGNIRDLAIKQFGLPPSPPTVGQTGSKPAQKQGNPPCKHTVQGASDNSWTALCVLYYNRRDQQTIDLLQGANPNIGTTPFGVGTVVNIPVYHLPRYFRATTTVRSFKAIAAKNGTSEGSIILLNNGKIHDPAPVGTQVRVS